MDKNILNQVDGNDIVVVLPGPPAPYRETRTAGGWVIELFVHTPTSLLENVRGCEHPSSSLTSRPA